jgi:HPr kinase/phosphorylase
MPSDPTQRLVEFRDQPATVSTFCERFRDRGRLEVVAGADWLSRPIREVTLNRPGLALAGFFKYFARNRIQVLGAAELTYLKSLGDGVARERLTEFFAQDIPCVVVTRGRKIPGLLLDLAGQFGVPLLRSPSITGHFVNQATLVLQDLNQPSTHFQGCALDIMGIGVLIEGPPAIGKSEAALGLIERGHSLVSDDVVALRRDSAGALLATAPDIVAYHLEIRGLGIIHVPSLFGMGSVTQEKRMDMVVQLARPRETRHLDRSGLDLRRRKVLDIELPLVILPVAPGRDMTGVIEVAVMNQKLKFLGHDAAKEFDARLIHRLQSKSHEVPNVRWRPPR